MQDSSAVFWHGIHRGFLTVWRERKWSSAFGALFGVLLLLQLLLTLMIGMQSITSLLQSRTDIAVTIVSNASDASVRDLYGTLQQLPYVKKAEYITQEKALERARSDNPELIAFVEEYGFENPLHDTINVSLLSLSDTQHLIQFVQQDRWKRMIEPEFFTNTRAQDASAHELLSLSYAGRSLVILFLVITGCLIVFIIIELTRARAHVRADEVMVERVSGADTASILIPFATEATLLSLIAIGLSTLCLLALLFALPLIHPGLVSETLLSSFAERLKPAIKELLPMYLLAEVICAPVFGTLGAWLGIRPHLKAKTLK